MNRDELRVLIKGLTRIEKLIKKINPLDKQTINEIRSIKTTTEIIRDKEINKSIITYLNK